MGYVPPYSRGRLEQKYGGLILVWFFGASMLALVGGLFFEQLPWWAWGLLVAPGLALVTFLLVAAFVLMLLAALEDYRGTP
jgi:hypothetical protein